MKALQLVRPGQNARPLPDKQVDEALQLHGERTQLLRRVKAIDARLVELEAAGLYRHIERDAEFVPAYLREVPSHG